MKKFKFEKLKSTNEKTLRNIEMPFFHSMKEVNTVVSCVLDKKLEYGTAVYAISLPTIAMFNYMCHKVGSSGFQASLADMDVLRRTRLLKDGFMIIDYNKLYYPQYLTKGHFPSWKELIKQDKVRLQEGAKQKLKESKGKTISPIVRNWWKKLAKGK